MTRPQSRWWRAYSAARNNPKLQRIDDRLFKTWFNLCCVASEKPEDPLPSIVDLAFELRLTEKDCERQVRALIAAGLIDEFKDGMRMHDWDEMQFQSDVSTGRVKRYRERKRNGKGNVSSGVSRNVSVAVSGTAPETETESEVSSLRSDTGAAGRKPPPPPPESQPTEKSASTARRGSRLPTGWQPPHDDWQFAINHLGPGRAQQELENFRDYWAGVPGQRGTKLDWPATWRNRIRDVVGRMPQSRAGPHAAPPNRNGFHAILDEIADAQHTDRSHDFEARAVAAPARIPAPGRGDLEQAGAGQETGELFDR